MIKVIIFDFFDVFRTDGYKAWLKQRGLPREGILKTASEQSDRGEITAQDFYAQIAEHVGEDPSTIERQMEDGIEFNHELVEYVKELKPSYKIALLSNCSSEYLRRELNKYGIEDLFDDIVISGEVGLIKPEPAIFEHIMQKLGVTPEECVFTDDNPHHVAAAERLGIRSIIFESVAQLRRDLERDGTL